MHFRQNKFIIIYSRQSQNPCRVFHLRHMGNRFRFACLSQIQDRFQTRRPFESQFQIIKDPKWSRTNPSHQTAHTFSMCQSITQFRLCTDKIPPNISSTISAGPVTPPPIAPRESVKLSKNSSYHHRLRKKAVRRRHPPTRSQSPSVCQYLFHCHRHHQSSSGPFRRQKKSNQAFSIHSNSQKRKPCIKKF